LILQRRHAGDDQAPDPSEHVPQPPDRLRPWAPLICGQQGAALCTIYHRNSFAPAAQQGDDMATEFNPFGDVTKMFEQFKVPGVDMAAMVEARRKDVEALIAANKAALESMQAIANKQAEMMTEAMQSLQQAAKTPSGGNVDPARQTEVVRKVFETTLTDMKELAELAHKSQVDAIALVTQRATEHVQEIQKLMQPK
jgi:phasin family protein